MLNSLRTLHIPLVSKLFGFSNVTVECQHFFPVYSIHFSKQHRMLEHQSTSSNLSALQFHLSEERLRDRLSISD